MMDLITWLTLLIPVPACIIASFAAMKLLLAYIPKRLDLIVSDFIKEAALPMITDSLNSPGDSLEEVRPVIEEHLDHFLGVKLGKEMPMVGMFVGEKTIAQMKQLFMQELALLFPEVMNRYVSGLMQKITSPAAGKTVAGRFRAAILPVLSKTLNRIPVFGSLTGIIISLLQFIIFSGMKSTQ
jgi:hypothetical protein